MKQTPYVCSLQGAVAGAVAIAAAGLDAPHVEAQGIPARAIIYAEDDRREVFEVRDQHARALIEGSVVAFMAKNTFADGLTLPSDAPSVGELANLCGGERFYAQPSLAFCTGVLVDRDLVLTAAHCLTDLPLEAMVAVFGYFYSEQGTLRLRPEDVVELAEVVDQTLAPLSDRMQLDYAFLRLARPAPQTRSPAPIRVALPKLRDPLMAVGASLGLPLKADAGALVRGLRADMRDYFVADSDTSDGASGGPAFDASSALLGVLARGGTDFDDRAACMSMVKVPAGQMGHEEFTYAYSALTELCKRDPSATSLCRADCGDPCTVLPEAEAALPEADVDEHDAGAGCATAQGSRSSAPGFWSGASLLALIGRWRSRRTGPKIAA